MCKCIRQDKEKDEFIDTYGVVPQCKDKSSRVNSSKLIWIKCAEKYGYHRHKRLFSLAGDSPLDLCRRSKIISFGGEENENDPGLGLRKPPDGSYERCSPSFSRNFVSRVTHNFT